MNKFKAFTLIELLVVIAIIAILAAILFPVFAQAKLAAKKTVALSNAKELATANMIYMGDFDDALVKEYFGFPSFPTCDWGAIPFGTSQVCFYNWRHALQPYVGKSTGLMQDPTNPYKDPVFWTGSVFDGNGVAIESLPSNYAVNNSVIGFANGSDQVNPSASDCTFSPGTPAGQPNLNGIEEPAGTIIMLPSRAQWNDLKWHFGAATGWPGGVASLNDTSWCINGSCPAFGNGPIHTVGGKQSVWVYSDGHAKTKAYAATIDASNATRDDWDSKLSTNPVTNVAFTQADRQFAISKLFPEYK